MIDSETDLQHLFEAEELHPDLAMYLNKSNSFQVLQHPLIYQVPYMQISNKLLNLRYAKAREQIANALQNKLWKSVIFLHERPYRFEALNKVASQLGDEYWSIVSDVWTDSENIWQNLAGWKSIWSDKRPGRESVMDEDEISTLQLMPDVMEVYRGTNVRAAIKGLSWTIDRSKAEWFARRYARNNTKMFLATGTVSKVNVLAYFSCRNENEIVVMPKNVQNINVNVIT
jgi:hypothetical protein